MPAQQKLTLSPDLAVDAKTRTAHASLKTAIGAGTGAAVYLTIAPAVIPVVSTAPLTTTLASVGGSVAIVAGGTGAIVVGTVLVFVLPAVVFAGFAGYRVYREVQQRNREEEELTRALIEKIEKLENLHTLDKMAAQIEQAFTKCWVMNLHLNVYHSLESELYEEYYRELLESTLTQIENLRNISGKRDYAEGSYKKLKQLYELALQKTINKSLHLLRLEAEAHDEPHDTKNFLEHSAKTLHAIERYQSLSSSNHYKQDYDHLTKLYNKTVIAYNKALPKPQQIKSYRPLNQPERFAIRSTQNLGFLANLKIEREEKGLSAAAWFFTKKAANMAYTFLGGVGVGLTIGAVVLAFTGVGLPAALGLAGAALVFGAVTTGVKYYATKHQSEKIQVLRDNTNILSNTQIADSELKQQIDRVVSLEEELNVKPITPPAHFSETQLLKQHEKLLKDYAELVTQQDKAKHFQHSSSTEAVAITLANGNPQEAIQELKPAGPSKQQAQDHPVKPGKMEEEDEPGASLQDEPKNKGPNH